MNKPIVITTFRSGSTVLTEMLAGLAVKYMGFKNYIDEPFTMLGYRSQSHHLSMSSYVNPRGEEVLFTCNAFKHDRSNESAESRHAERLRRLHMFQNNSHTYMFKVMADVTMPQEVIKWCSEERTPIFLERRDRMAQLVSWCSYLYYPPHLPLYSRNDPWKVDHIPYDQDMCLYYIKSHIHAYDAWKKQYPSAQVVYFEDVMTGVVGRNVSNILGLDLSEEQVMAVKPGYRPIPYSTKNREDLIRSPGWKQDRAMLEQLIYSEM